MPLRNKELSLVYTKFPTKKLAFWSPHYILILRYKFSVILKLWGPSKTASNHWAYCFIKKIYQAGFKIIRSSVCWDLSVYRFTGRTLQILLCSYRLKLSLWSFSTFLKRMKLYYEVKLPSFWKDNSRTSRLSSFHCISLTIKYSYQISRKRADRFSSNLTNIGAGIEEKAPVSYCGKKSPSAEK